MHIIRTIQFVNFIALRLRTAVWGCPDKGAKALTAFRFSNKVLLTITSGMIWVGRSSSFRWWLFSVQISLSFTRISYASGLRVAMNKILIQRFFSTAYSFSLNCWIFHQDLKFEIKFLKTAHENSWPMNHFYILSLRNIVYFQESWMQRSVQVWNRQVFFLSHIGGKYVFFVSSDSSDLKRWVGAIFCFRSDLFQKRVCFRRQQDVAFQFLIIFSFFTLELLTEQFKQLKY